MAKGHLTIRNRKREKITSGLKPTDSTFEEVLLLLYFVLSFFLGIVRGLKALLLPSQGPSQLEGEDREDEKTPVSEEVDTEESQPVTARGIGLLAAYSGRRAIFAVYPPLEDGLEVSSEGPAPIHFDYKLKKGMLLVGYEAPKPGRYQLRVSRFGRSSQGSPFVLKVEEPPPGYRGYFGAALWQDVPVRPPILSGIVDFVTERMYLDENGRLFKLNKDGTVSNERYLAKRSGKLDDRKTPPKTDERTEITYDKVNDPKNSEICNVISKPLTDDEIMAILCREKLDFASLEKYKALSETLSKELNTNPNSLNLLGTEHCVSNEHMSPRRSLVVPKITITNVKTNEELQTEHNHSRVNQFLSESECRYTAHPTVKLQRVAGDDAVSSEACDDWGQIGARGQSPPTANDSKLIDFILQSGSQPRERKKYYRSNLTTALGLSKKPCNQTGIRLLHDIYKAENRQGNENEPNFYSERVLNNGKVGRKDYYNVHKLIPDSDSEINSLGIGNIPLKIHNSKQLVTTHSESHIQAKNTGTKPITKLPRKKQTETNRIYRGFRTLSLPDFNRILSLSIQGLRKAKSCGDKSFRALSSSSLSLSLKSLFEKDQVYYVNKKNHPDKTKSCKEAATLVRIAHYGSGKEARIIETGTKSVVEWRKYWETAEYKKSTETTKVCHLQIKGIVTKGRELFEPTSEELCVESSPSRQTSKESTPRSLGTLKNEIKGENKTAFQKAKEIFEGNYSSLKDFENSRNQRKRSISERFQISSLSEDIYAGVTPEHLGIPNRIPVLASLGSVYDYSSVYHQIPLSHSPEQYVSCTDLLFSDPSYV